MRKLIIVTALLSPLNSWGECLKYEYAEVNSMSKAELQSAYYANKTEVEYITKVQALLISMERIQEADEQTKLYNVCQQQADKLNRISIKRFATSLK